MGIGGCVIVLALGAILAFAVDWHISGVNLHLAGVILMLAGLIGLIAYVRVLRRRRLGGLRGAEVVEERRYVD
ncbi:DUF6458 family protein [Kitasatospora sp. NPDC049258]|uniref:DUF6458 family protein n=1 Tax=Kitasatospora sp. NPDC049258 TaxID=3155394 RepID=UPI00341D9DFD